MGSTPDHWNRAYAAKLPETVSWYQPRPEVSLELIGAACPDRRAAIIDMGGGASTLADGLVERGYQDVTVLDLSAEGMARSRARLGAHAGQVRWIEADATRWQPDRQWDLWHDRAAFHFLTDPADQEAYLARMRQGTRPGSHLIIATFAPDGPEKCSGLPVCRYDARSLTVRIGEGFTLIDQRRETHRTPGGIEQRFSHAVLRRE